MRAEPGTRVHTSEDFVFDPLHYLSAGAKDQRLEQSAGWLLPPVFGDLAATWRGWAKPGSGSVQVLRLIESFSLDASRHGGAGGGVIGFDAVKHLVRAGGSGRHA